MALIEDHGFMDEYGIGCGWTFLGEARDSSPIEPGASIALGAVGAPIVAEVMYSTETLAGSVDLHCFAERSRATRRCSLGEDTCSTEEKHA